MLWLARALITWIRGKSFLLLREMIICAPGVNQQLFVRGVLLTMEAAAPFSWVPACPGLESLQKVKNLIKTEMFQWHLFLPKGLWVIPQNYVTIVTWCNDATGDNWFIKDALTEFLEDRTSPHSEFHLNINVSSSFLTNTQFSYIKF